MISDQCEVARFEPFAAASTGVSEQNGIGSIGDNGSDCEHHLIDCMPFVEVRSAGQKENRNTLQFHRIGGSGVARNLRNRKARDLPVWNSNSVR